MAVGQLIGGFILLVFGGDALVKASVSIAGRFRLSPALIGLTVVAAGTSAPEMAASVLASLKGISAIALGNVIGSNIFNILAVLGLTSLISPTTVSARVLNREIPLLIIFTFLLIYLEWDLTITRLEGLVAILGLFAFIMYSFVVTPKNSADAQSSDILKHPILDLLWLTLGFAGLILGSHWALEGGVAVGQMGGLSERIIGIVIISTGTSLPELAASVMAAIRGHHDIAIANVIGSNVFNTLGIVGVSAILEPLTVDPALLGLDSLWLLATTLLLWPLISIGRYRINRPAGFLLCVGYVSYLGYLATTPG